MSNITNNDPRYSPQRQKNQFRRLLQMIDDPTEENQLAVLKQLKEALETVAGERGPMRDRGVSMRDLEELGLIIVRDVNGEVQNNNIQENLKTAQEELVATYRHKNLAINGSMQVFQRNVSGTVSVTGIYTADRWKAYENSDGVVTFAASSDVPTKEEAGVEFNSSLLFTVTTADATLGTGQYMGMYHGVEGYLIKPYKNGYFTISFWVKSSITGTFSFSAREAGNTYALVQEFTVNAADTWEKKELTFLHDDTNGTWDYSNGRGFWMGITLACATGTLSTSTLDQWVAGNKIASDNQTNWLGTLANTFRITGIQLEAGDVATEFDHLNFCDELQACRRYFQHTYSYGTYAGATTSIGCHSFYGATSAANRPITEIQWDTRMRGLPTVTFYNPATGTAGQARNFDASTNWTFLQYVVGEQRVSGYVNGTPGAGNIFGVHATANADF